MKTRFSCTSTVGRVLVGAAFVLTLAMPVGGLGAQAEEFSLPPPDAPESGPVVSLADAVLQADTDNRSIKVLRQDIVIAAQKLRSSWSGLLPSLYGSVNVSRSNQVNATTGATVMGQMSAGLSLNVPLIDAQTWLNMKSAEIESEVTELQVEEARQVLLYSVAEAYFQAATALSLIDVYRAQYDAANEHMKLAEGRLDAGVGNIMDIRSAQTDLLTAWTGMVKAGYSLSDAREALALLMGTDELPMPVPQAAASGRDIRIDEAISALAQGSPGLPDVDTEAVEGRWDMKVLRKQQTLLKSELKAAYMPFTPRLDAFFNYTADLLGNSPTGDRHSWNMGLALTVPLFDYTIYPALRLKKASIHQSELQIDEIRAEARKAARESARNVRMLERMMAAARVKAALADDLLSLAEADYANGTGLAIAVTDARRTSQSAHVDLATATWEYEIGLLKLGREVGTDIREAVRGR